MGGEFNPGDLIREFLAVRKKIDGKERYVMLSEPLLASLRSYWRLARPERFLFPGRGPDKPIEPTVLHAACRSAAAAAGSCSVNAGPVLWNPIDAVSCRSVF